MDSIDQVLVVEEFYSRPFCSESCIVDYFRPLMLDLDRQDLELRLSLGVKEKFDHKLLKDDPNLLNLMISNPDEVLVTTNDLGEEFYTVFKTVDHKELKIYLVGIFFYYEDNVSLMLFNTATGDRKLAEAYADGEDPSKEDPLDQYEIDPEILEDLEQKKSEQLSELLTRRSDHDIPFEKFPLYDQFLKLTLNDPDEVYENKVDFDLIHTYIKSYQHKNLGSFYYVVMAIKIDEDVEGDEDVLLPILAFPSIDRELYKYYKLGHKVSGSLKN